MKQEQFLTILVGILIAATATLTQLSTGRAAIQEGPAAPTANEWDQSDPTAWDWYFNVSATELTHFMVDRNERLSNWKSPTTTH